MKKCIPQIQVLVGIICCILYIAYLNKVSVVQGYKMLSSSQSYLANCFTCNIYLFIILLALSILGFLYLTSDRPEFDSNRFADSLVCLGNNSYTLYLFHYPILAVVKRVVGQYYIMFPIVFAASCISVWIFNKLLFLFKNFWREHEK